MSDLKKIIVPFEFTDSHKAFFEGYNKGRTDTLREMEPVIEALRFYADIGNWNYDKMMIREDYSGSFGCGQKARQALAMYAEAVGEKINNEGEVQ